MHVQRETSIHLGVTGRKHLPYKRGNCMKELAFQLFRSGQFGIFLRTSIFVTKARDIIFLAGMYVQRETSIWG